MSDWGADIHVRIATAIKKARGKRSAQWLADRTAELGYPLTRSQIANYESGRKKRLDVAELLVLCAALGTSPVTLVFPGPYDEPSEVLPGQSPKAFYGAQWWSGEALIGVPSGDTETTETWLRSTSDLRRWRELATAVRIRAALLAQSDDYSRVVHYDEQIARLSEELGVSDAPSILGFGNDDA